MGYLGIVCFRELAMHLAKHRWFQSKAGGIAPSMVAAVMWWLICGPAAPPVMAQAEISSDLVPVVFVPGVTGVGLRHRVTGKAVWGRGNDMLGPHDRGHGTARPLFEGRGGPDLVPDGVILNLRLLGFWRIRVYQPFLDMFESNGYQFGDLEHPRSTDDVFFFSYDWRQDNVDSAALLAEQLEGLRQIRGEENLRVNLICQSNGAHICRYFTKYGALDLAKAEAGERRVEEQLEVDRLILVGSSNGGSIRILRELNRGRRYIPGIGRFWSPETLFSYLSLYQDLPAYTKDLFVDAGGQAMAVDLFAAENWRKFGWSVFQPEVRKLLTGKRSEPWFGTEEERMQFLQNQLDRARRFHKVLEQDVEGFGSTRYYLIMNTHNETSSRAVLFEKDGRWQSAFEDDNWVQRDPVLRTAVITHGDGHATTRSQEWLSAQERGRIAADPIDVEGTHRRIVLQAATHRALLDILGGKLDSAP